MSFGGMLFALTVPALKERQTATRRATLSIVVARVGWSERQRVFTHSTNLTVIPQIRLSVKILALNPFHGGSHRATINGAIHTCLARLIQWMALLLHVKPADRKSETCSSSSATRTWLTRTEK